MTDQDKVEGERMYLRKVCASDVNDNYVRWMNDPEVMQYLESRFVAHTPESILAFVKQMSVDKNHAFLAMVLKQGDRHIGNIKLGPIDWHHGLGDIGLLVGEKDCWGKGYAAEAIDLMTRHAFQSLKLHKVTAGCYENNLGSMKAFLKVGFVEEARLKQHFLCEGSYVDKICMAKIKK